MILVTIGTQLPFDRLVQTVERWAASRGRTDVVMQIGEGRAPAGLRWVRSLSPEAFRDHLARAELVVAHAGMGITLSALAAGRPILILPRRASLGEHRNEHQLATARRLVHVPGVRVCEDEGELAAALDAPPAPPTECLSATAPEPLLAAVRGFVFAKKVA